jgi:hypothetical protein
MATAALELITYYNCFGHILVLCRWYDRRYGYVLLDAQERLCDAQMYCLSSLGELRLLGCGQVVALPIYVAFEGKILR